MYRLPSQPVAGRETPRKPDPPREPAPPVLPVPLLDKVLAAVVFSLGIALLYSTYILIE